MNARLQFALLNFLVALFSAVLGEWRVDTESSSQTSLIVYGLVSPISAVAMSNGVMLDPLQKRNFSHFARFVGISMVTMLASCVGVFAVIAATQPMGFVTGALIATAVFIAQFYAVGIVYVPLLVVLSCVLFRFASKAD